jgi:hypothetical protein
MHLMGSMMGQADAGLEKSIISAVHSTVNGGRCLRLTLPTTMAEAQNWSLTF